MVSGAGKQAFLKERGDIIATLLKAGVTICLADVRGTGETRAGSSAERGSSRTSISQTNLILGQSVIGSQLRDLRAVIRWLRGNENLDGKKVAIWGDSFAKENAPEVKTAIPFDSGDTPAIGDPNAGIVAGFATVFESDITAIYTRGQFAYKSVLGSPYLAIPHDGVVPGMLLMGGYLARGEGVRGETTLDALNRPTGDKPMSLPNAAAWVIGKLK